MTDLPSEVRRVRRLGQLLAVLTVLLLIVIALYSWPLLRTWFGRASGNPRPVTERGPLASFENVAIDVSDRAGPSVVFITRETRWINRRSGQVQEVAEGSGSGFIWDEFGHIITNNHVIESKNSSSAPILHVILSDQTSYDAEVVGTSADHDLAVLKINPQLGTRLIPIPIGRSSDLKVGQAVFAIGNPFGLDQSVSAGIVSALKRVMPNISNRSPMEDLIQTDAAINPGNSGGTLLDSAGRLIGVNTLIVSPTGTSSGIGYAIPVDTVNRVVPQLITTGKYQRAIIGIRFDDALQMRLPAGVQGLAVLSVDPDSPAQRAGLSGATLPPPTRGRGVRQYVLGDVITHLNDKPIKNAADLFIFLDHVTPGDTVEITLWNNSETRKVPVKTQ